MALKFLHKKNFHTANLKNIEKVWLAEQKKAQDDKRIEQLRREIEEERQIQELRDLQAKATGKTQTARLDWMYEGHLAKSFNQDAKTAEDYLLGKPVQAEKDDTQKLQAGEGPGALFVQKGASAAMDAQTKLKEDPMFEIRVQEKKALDLIKNNPVRMSVLREEALKMKEGKLRKKLEKKARKKEEKEKRKRRHSSGSSSSDSDDGKRRGPAPAPAPGRDRERDHERERDRGRERGRDRSRSRSRSRDRGGDRDRSRDKGRDRSRSRSAERGGGRRDERGQLIGEADRTYGLVKPRGGLTFPTERKEEKKVEVLPESRVDPYADKKRAAWEARERARKMAAQSAEDREARLREMRADAERNEHVRTTRKREDAEKAAAEEKAVAAAQVSKDVQSTFLGAVQRSVYADEAATTEGRIRSTAHFRQRPGGDFLRK